MASGLSIYQANKVVDKIMRATDFTPTASYWVALFTNAGAAAFLRTNDIGSATEVGAGLAYARVQVRSGSSITWAVASGGWSEQAGDITFSQATGSWGTVYTAALMDAATAGNVILYGDLDVAKVVSPPDIFRIPAGFFDIQF